MTPRDAYLAAAATYYHWGLAAYHNNDLGVARVLADAARNFYELVGVPVPAGVSGLRDELLEVLAADLQERKKRLYDGEAPPQMSPAMIRECSGQLDTFALLSGQVCAVGEHYWKLPVCFDRDQFCQCCYEGGWAATDVVVRQLLLLLTWEEYQGVPLFDLDKCAEGVNELKKVPELEETAERLERQLARMHDYRVRLRL